MVPHGSSLNLCYPDALLVLCSTVAVVLDELRGPLDVKILMTIKLATGQNAQRINDVKKKGISENEH